MRKKRGKKSLIKAIGHVAYEIQLFHVAYAMWLKPEINRNDLLRNVFIETFILHTRNLYEFFYRQKKNQPRVDDMIVDDFLSNKRLIIFRANRTKKTEIDRIFIKKRADKELAHISYYRLRKTPTTKAWKIPEIYNQMQKTIKAFLGVINDE